MTLSNDEPLFLMSYPRPDWGIRGGSNFLSQKASAPSPRAAFQDWLAVAQSIQDAGGHVLVMPPCPTDNLTGLPYTAEAGEFCRDAQGKPLFVLPHMKAPHRKLEPTYTAGFVAALGWTPLATKAIWEAQGDAIRLGKGRVVHTCGEGPSTRTAPEAYHEVAAHLGNQHIQLHFRADPWFHGNTFLAYFEGKERAAVLYCPDALAPGQEQHLRAFAPDLEWFALTRQESLSYATNALQVNRTVIAPEGTAERIESLWRDLGLRVQALPLTELFRRGGGAAVCLTNRLYGLRPDQVPTSLLFAHQAPALRTYAATYPEQPAA